MNKTTKQIGDEGESLAEEVLIAAGCDVIARNYRTRFGEIDIIAKDGPFLVFVEVKAKSDDYFGNPAEMITEKKLWKIRRTAESYIAENKYEGPWRIDAVIIKNNCAEIIQNVTR